LDEAGLGGDFEEGVAVGAHDVVVPAEAVVVPSVPADAGFDGVEVDAVFVGDAVGVGEEEVLPGGGGGGGAAGVCG